MHDFSYSRVMSMGGHLFFQTWICMAMIFEPYLGCHSSIFSQTLVCCSWEYGLSAAWSSILNQMSVTRSNYRFKMWEMSEAYHLNLSAWQITSSYYCHAYLSSSRFNFFLLWCHIRKKKIWKIFRRRGLAVRWKMFWKIIINIWYISRSNK